MRQFNPNQLKIPTDAKYELAFHLAKIFSELHLEIGAGVGLHPIQFSFAQDEIGLIAIERTREKYVSFLQRVLSNKKKYPDHFKNLLAINADIVPWLWHFDHQIKFDKIWILYPNPEPGNKNQRWIHAPFFFHLIERLKPSGEIEIATNIQNYAEEVHEFAFKNWNLKSQKAIYTGPGRTHFEKKYLERSETCYQIFLNK